MSGAVFALYARLYPVMQTYARKRGHNDPEAFAHDVFARTLPGKYVSKGWRPDAYIYTIARNLMIDYWRHRAQRVTVHEPKSKSFVDHYPCESQHIRDAIRTLPERHRLVLYLRFWEGQSIAQTAAFMGISEGAVKSLQFRALDGVRQVLLPPREDE
ncbi:MAG: RNA polymerase sigma factor [Thioalkalivibrio sp.]|nr:RNA polymerase sigma factor [Thioalkalivibrio sp.]